MVSRSIHPFIRLTTTRSYSSALIPKCHNANTHNYFQTSSSATVTATATTATTSPHLQNVMAAVLSSPIQSSPSTSTSPSISSSPSSSSPPPPHSPSLSPSNPNSLNTTPDPNPNTAPTVALPPPAAIALPQHPPPQSQPSSNPPPSAPTSTRRVPPPCWSVEETVALIDGYQDKWYTLRRGNLKANHWQDVADFVTSRCANLPGSSHKTAVQCRHKVEKLRKRYRSERQRCLRNQNRTSNSRTNSSSTWYFFKKMDAMELGPISNAPNRNHTSNNGNILSSASNRDISGGYSNAIPTSVPSRHVPPQSTSPSDASSNDSDDDSEGDVGIGNNNINVRNLHGLVSNGSGMKFKIPKAVRSRGGMPMLRSEGGGSMPVMYPRSSVYPSSSNNQASVGLGPGGSSRFTRGVYTSSGMRSEGLSGMEEMRGKMDKKRGRDGVGRSDGGMEEIVSAVRMLGDGFMRMEQMKMDMEKEIHNMRMEMELKHTEMILDTQRQIVDTFLNGFLDEEKKSKKANLGDS